MSQRREKEKLGRQGSRHMVKERKRERESNRTKLHAIRLTDSTTNQNYRIGRVIVTAGSMHILNYTSKQRGEVCFKLGQD